MNFGGDFSLSVFLLLVLPIVISASLHMVIVRWRLFAFIARPVSEKHFGQNKTWRGMIAMPLLTVLGIELCTLAGQALSVLPGFWPADFIHRIVIALGLGFFYVLFELPNSYFKRRMGIKPGQRAEKHVWFTSFFDQADSAIGCALFYLLVLPETATYFWWLVILGPGIHLLGNVALYSVGLRKEAL